MPCSCQCGAEGLSSLHAANVSDVSRHSAKLHTQSTFTPKGLDEDSIVGLNSFQNAFSSVTWALDGSIAIFTLVAWWPTDVCHKHVTVLGNDLPHCLGRDCDGIMRGRLELLKLTVQTDLRSSDMAFPVSSGMPIHISRATRVRQTWTFWVHEFCWLCGVTNLLRVTSRHEAPERHWQQLSKGYTIHKRQPLRL